MRLLVFGRQGQVARSLREAAAHEKDVDFLCVGRPEVDLARPETITAAITQFRPDIIVNPAAYTAVDKAELEPELAFEINRDGAGAIAIAAARENVPIIHFSTDYVFDGKKSGFYDEHDVPNPQTVYGRSKLEGERAVALANPRHVILRTSWVYAPFGGNFVKTIWGRIATGQPLRVVNDQTGCPTYAPDIAVQTIRLARGLIDTGWRPEFAGVTDMVGPDALTWYAFAREILNGYVARGGKSVEVAPVPSSEYVTRACRPLNSRLSTERLKSVFDIRLPHLEVSLGDCLDRLVKN
jgi:dTDP-4-dehydrorhamnose reductase